MFCQGQDINDFQSFRQEMLGNFAIERLHFKDRFHSFRDSLNAEYVDFLAGAWKQYKSSEPVPRPKEIPPVPPRPYVPEEDSDEPVVVTTPVVLPSVVPSPRPEPVEPINGQPVESLKTVDFSFYGLKPQVRVPQKSGLRIFDVSPRSISEGWKELSGGGWDAALADCLEIRERQQLSDWAYLQLLHTLSESVESDKNAATLLCAYLFCQSGYKMRLAENGGKLVMLFGSRHHIYQTPFYVIDDESFFPYADRSWSLNICDVPFKGEKPLSLIIDGYQLLGDELSEPREIKSKRYPDMNVVSRVPLKLLDFFETYPPSAIGDNPLSQWGMYAEAPLSKATTQLIYPVLKEKLAGSTELEAANKLLNWIQTGLEYEYDDVVWGDDRAFFAEETLFYPYCDCEDRAILFSRLVRDLLGLDVALIYYPGHMAAAVKFNENVDGDAVMIEGRKFVVCDPTYIGARVGKQMPDLDSGRIEALELKK